MDDSGCAYPESVSTTVQGGKEIFIVGTAHVSRQSVEDVIKTVNLVNPDAICIELCEARYNSLINRDQWKNMDIVKIIKEKKALLLLAQLVGQSFYRKLGSQLDVKPGAEMMEGVALARNLGKQLVLADRNIDITFKRIWNSLNLWNKATTLSQMLMGVFFTEKIDAALVEELKKQDQLEYLLNTFARSFPKVKNVLIDERDIVLAHAIAHAPGKKVVAILGAGHVRGVLNHIRNNTPIGTSCDAPPKSRLSSAIGWSIPALIVLLFIIGFLKGGVHQSVESAYLWILITGGLAALGTAFAFGHPLTVLSSFIAAPFTALHPLIAVGWISGLIQAFVKKPTVKDFEDLPAAIGSIKGFWRNPVCRILLVIVLANLGASLGTFVAGGYLAKKLF